jgi:hypothetical protein
MNVINLKFCEISVFQTVVSDDSRFFLGGEGETWRHVVEWMAPDVFNESSAKGQAAHGVKLPKKFYLFPKYKFSVLLSLHQDYNE